MQKKIIKFVTTALLLLILLAFAYWYHQYQTSHPSTDNAYIRSDIAYIATTVNGTVANTQIHNRQHVSKNQPLFSVQSKSLHSIRAPIDGQILKFTLYKGSKIRAYQTLFLILGDKRWIEANFKETALRFIHPGQHATIKIDMYPKHAFKGKVKSISPASVSSFALLPAENTSGNWVKVVQRFPVHITLTSTDKQHPLRVGASCQVTLNAHSPS